MSNQRKHNGDGSSEIGKAKGKRRVGRRECYTRFSRQEQEMLLDGIRKFGAGNWRQILRAYTFHEKRTAVDLKDKYRNILRAEEREKSFVIRSNCCKRKAMTKVELERIVRQQGLVCAGGLHGGDVKDKVGWESRMKNNGGLHVTVSRTTGVETEIGEVEIGERVEVCRPPAAMRLERLLCPTD